MLIHSLSSLNPGLVEYGRIENTSKKAGYMSEM